MPDLGLTFTAPNVRRLMNITDKNAFKQFLEDLAFHFLAKSASPKLFTRQRRPSFLPLTFASPEINAAAIRL